MLATRPTLGRGGVTAPHQPDSWLAQRLARFGPLPCAYLLGASDFGKYSVNSPEGTSETRFLKEIGFLGRFY
ncbi:hypothetical protein QUF63_05400 [Anaerolineales bacterium HSG25]|nr:hypothetical protein [Anaerolineales bacterium HSG25]